MVVRSVVAAVRKDDAEVGHLLAARHGRAAGSGLEALQDGAVFDDRALDEQTVGGKVGVVLGIGYRAAEGLGQEPGGLARNERQVLDRLGSLAALYCAGDLAHLLWGHVRVAVESLDFHVCCRLRGRLPVVSAKPCVGCLDFLAGHAAVRLEDAGRGELAELVPHHVLRDIHGYEHLAVVDVECVADKVGSDGRATRPGLDRLLRSGLARLLDLFEKVIVNEESFLDGTGHGGRSWGLFLAARLAAVVVEENEPVGALGSPPSPTPSPRPGSRPGGRLSRSRPSAGGRASRPPRTSCRGARSSPKWETGSR